MSQVPALNIFESSLRRGKFDESRKLSDGSLMEFAKVYPMDAVYDKPEDVPQDVRAASRHHVANLDRTARLCNCLPAHKLSCAMSKVTSRRFRLPVGRPLIGTCNSTGSS